MVSWPYFEILTILALHARIWEQFAIYKPREKQKMTNKTYKFIAITASLIAIASFGASHVAKAYAFCDTVTASITNHGSQGGGATAVATNNSDTCTARVTFTSYKIFITPSQPGWLDTQVLNDTETITLAPHQSASFSVSNPNCKYQLDIYEGEAAYHLSDADSGMAGGTIRLLDWYISGDNLCANNPPQLVCSPATQTVMTNFPANFSASGGNGNYSWSGGGTPATGNGADFSSFFSTSGAKTVTVTDGNQTAQCGVNVIPPAPTPLSCQPQTQTVNVGDIAVFSATGGNGNYFWSSPGVPSSGVGTNFSSAFSTSGTKTVTVTDGTQTRQCSVNVNQVIQPLTCSPSSQTGNVGAILNFSASGGNGTYSWNTGDGNPASGDGAVFSTSFATAGSKTITVTSGGETVACGATITQTTCNLPQTWLTATTNVGQNSATLNGYVDPQGQPTTYYFEYGASSSYGQRTAEQTVISGQSVSATITGLQPNTLYYFHLVVRSSCGTNQTQAWTFQTSGNPTPPYQPPYYPPYNPPPYYPPVYPPYNPSVVCGPQTQNVLVGDWVSFWTSGASGNLSWNASNDASPSYGNGSGFGTSFQTPGQKIVTVTSNSGGSSQCAVIVRPKGTVLGAADIVTGPEDAWPMAMVLGLFASILAYYFYFGPKLALKNSGPRIQVIDAAPIVSKPKRKTELEKLLEGIRAGEQAPDA
jgi:hypothetical protein